MTRLGKIGLLLLLCATTIGGFLWLPPASGPFLVPALARIVVFHVPCAIVTDVASLVAAWFAVIYLRSRDPLADVKSRAAYGPALLFSALTTITGAIFAKSQWGGYWNWDPKQTLSLMLMLVYIAYYALRGAIEDPRKSATVGAAYALFALAAVPFLTYILPNSVESLHPKDVINTPDGLDSRYKIILWGGSLGLTFVFLWAFRIRVALGSIELRMQKMSKRTAAPVTATRVVRQGN